VEGQRGRGEKGARDKVTKRRRDGRREWKGGGGQRPLAKQGRVLFAYQCMGVPGCEVPKFL